MGSNVNFDAGKEVPSFESLQRSEALRQGAARAEDQRRAAQARRVRAIFDKSDAQKYMIFQKFRSQSVRKKILKGYGLEPVYLPHEGRPGTRSRKPRNRDK